MTRKLPKLLVPGTGTANPDLRMAEKYAANGNHGWAAAHYKLASLLMVRDGRVAASNRAWSKYRLHKQAYLRGEGPDA